MSLLRRLRKLEGQLGRSRLVPSIDDVDERMKEPEKSAGVIFLARNLNEEWNE